MIMNGCNCKNTEWLFSHRNPPCDAPIRSSSLDAASLRSLTKPNYENLHDSNAPTPNELISSTKTDQISCRLPRDVKGFTGKYAMHAKASEGRLQMMDIMAEQKLCATSTYFKPKKCHRRSYRDGPRHGKGWKVEA